MNGGAGERFWVRVPTLVTRGWSARIAVGVSLGGIGIADVERGAIDPDDVCREPLARVGRQERLDRPVLAGRERGDLALALDDEPHRDRLDPSRRKAAAHLARQERAERVADQPVDDAPSLLGVDEVLVDPARVRERLADRRFGDLAERHAMGLGVGDVGRLGDVPGDRLALAVEVRGQVDRVGALGGLLDVGDLLAPVRRDHVLRLEVVVDVDAELALAGILRQVPDMAVRGQDSVICAEIALDGSGLGRRLDDRRGSSARPGV